MTEKARAPSHKLWYHSKEQFALFSIDSHVMQIRLVATLLGYGEPQILEVFKNTLPTKLYWILFPIEDFKTSSRNSKKNIDQRKVR